MKASRICRIINKVKILIILIINIKLWPKENNLQSVMQLLSSLHKELPSQKTVLMLSSLLPAKKQAKLLSMQQSKHLMADPSPISSDQSQEDLHLPQLLKNLPSRLLSQLRSLQRKLSPNKSLSQLKSKKWIWEDSLIDCLSII